MAFGTPAREAESEKRGPPCVDRYKRYPGWLGLRSLPDIATHGAIGGLAGGEGKTGAAGLKRSELGRSIYRPDVDNLLVVSEGDGLSISDGTG